MDADSIEDIDVLVVGAGPVGVSTAVELRRFGVDCRIVEARTERTAGSRALTLHAGTLQLLDRRGTARQFVQRGRPVEEMALVVGRGRRARLDFTDLDTPFPFVLVLPQVETETLLEEHLAALGGEVLRGRRLTALDNRADHVIATTTSPEGQVRRWRARWLVAADGADSTVRTLIGAPVRGDREGLTYYGADVTIDGLAPTMQLIWSSTGFGVIAPFRDGTFRVAVTAPADTSGTEEAADHCPARPSLADIQAQVDRVFPEPVSLSGATWTTTLHGGHRQLVRYRHGRVLFAGDAAHTHNPAGGQGMNIGLHDSFDLGWKLAAALTSDAPDRIVDTYHDDRYPAAARVIAQTRRSMQLAHPRSTALRVVRDIAVTHIPRALRRRIARSVAGLDVHQSVPRRGLLPETR